MLMSTQTLAKLSALYAGVVFGVYWLPLRALDDAGFEGAWAAVAMIGLSVAIVSPFLLYRWRRLVFAGPRFHICGLLAGTAFALYATSFLFTEVIRTVLLFYLTPIWGFFLARVVIGEVITPVRWAAIGLGLIGLLVICGAEAGMPLPRNVGDWMALCAGIFWAVASLMMLTDPKSDAANYASAFLFYGMLGSTAIALFATAAPTPDLSALVEVLPWLIPVAVLIVIPASFATIYGPTKLNPGVVGMLFMSEISVATITAALLAGEPFGLRECVGALAITSAALLEPLLDFINARRQSARHADSAP